MKNRIILYISIIFLTLSSCSKDDGVTIETTTNDEINAFVWRGLASFYLWQKDVPDLAATRFANLNEVYTHFRSFDSPESVFSSLLYNYGTVDRFSIMVQDYVALENSFLGINISTGMEFGLVRYQNNSNNLFGYVRYVVPNSDAESKGIQRGMLFNLVDGQQLTVNNYVDLLLGANVNYTIALADYNAGNPIENGTSIALTKSQIEENPVKIAKVFEEGTTKIGYLLYNQFVRSYDAELNAAFAMFKAENIDELIIDLRYNPGGSTKSATYLGSMITGQFTGNLFSKESWNDNVMAANPPALFVNNFTNEIRNLDSNGNVVLEQTINSLGLDKAYFIVTGSSASASELVINSLSAYIDVRLVGKKTVGKQVGSITLYDSDNLFRNGGNLNNAHNYAMQPIVFEIKNKDNQNYPNGIVPGISLNGIDFGEDYSNLGVLGARNEPLLDRTIQYITTGAKALISDKIPLQTEEVYHSKLSTITSNNMYKDLNGIDFNFK